MHLQKVPTFFVMSIISFRDIAITGMHALSSIFHSPMKGGQTQSLSTAASCPREHFLAYIRELIVAFSPIMLLANVVLKH